MSCIHIWCFYQTFNHSITTHSLPKPPFQQQKLRFFTSMLSQDLTLWIYQIHLSLTKAFPNFSIKSWIQIPSLLTAPGLFTSILHIFHQEHFTSDLSVHCIRIANKWHRFPQHSFFLEKFSSDFQALSGLLDWHFCLIWALWGFSGCSHFCAHQFFCKGSRACRSSGTCVGWHRLHISLVLNRIYNCLALESECDSEKWGLRREKNRHFV